MAARPVAGRHGAGFQRHADAVALVEAGAAHLGEVPAGAEVACPPGSVGLEAAAGEHDGPRADVRRAPADARVHAVHAVVVREQGERRSLVVDGDARLRCGLVESADETRPAAPGLDREPAPEAEAPVLPPECLAAVARLKAHALPAHPRERGVAAGDELLNEVGVGAVLGESRHVVVVVGLGVGAEIGLRPARARRGRASARGANGAVEDRPHGAGGIAAVAAALVFRRGLQQASCSTP